MKKRTIMSKKQNQDGLIKSIILLGLLSGIFVSTGVILSTYSQHLYLDNQTIVDGIIDRFSSDGIVNIRGNQVQYSPGSVIPLDGRDYIRITGNQVQIDGETFTPAIRIVSAQIQQNILFEHKIGTFNINSTGRVAIDDVNINFIPVTRNILNVQTQDSNYNIEFVNTIVYMKSKNVMLRLVQNSDNIEIYLVGTQKYNSIIYY